ncbi:MAG TPA: hypothetical protein DDW52_23495 [Planctomycetaceae bacterium]|nr:hypothetical protein [Planctomycetaceae bacterium]
MSVLFAASAHAQTENTNLSEELEPFRWMIGEWKLTSHTHPRREAPTERLDVSSSPAGDALLFRYTTSWRRPGTQGAMSEGFRKVLERATWNANANRLDFEVSIEQIPKPNKESEQKDLFSIIREEIESHWKSDTDTDSLCRPLHMRGDKEQVFKYRRVKLALELEPYRWILGDWVTAPSSREAPPNGRLRIDASSDGKSLVLVYRAETLELGRGPGGPDTPPPSISRLVRERVTWNSENKTFEFVASVRYEPEWDHTEAPRSLRFSVKKSEVDRFWKPGSEDAELGCRLLYTSEGARRFFEFSRLRPETASDQIRQFQQEWRPANKIKWHKIGID